MGLPRSNLVKKSCERSDAPAPFVGVARAVAPALAPAHEPFRTTADSVEIGMGDLLERAAELGPARMTWESIVVPDDPILHEKRTPHVTERRARLTRGVKIALGACLGLCVLALGVSALSGDSPDPRAAASETFGSFGKTAPSQGIVPVEPMDGTKHAKAVRRDATVTTAAIARAKRR